MVEGHNVTLLGQAYTGVIRMKNGLLTVGLALAIMGAMAIPATAALPQSKRLPQAKTQLEFDAYNAAMADQNDPTAMGNAADDFASKFPESELRVLLYRAAMNRYQNANNGDKMLETSQKLLKLDPDDPGALITSAEVIAGRTQPTQADKDQRFEEAKRYAERALKTTETDAPAGYEPNQIETYKEFLRARAFGVLGAIEYSQGEYAVATANLRKSIDAYPIQTDPVVVLRLALALDKQGKYADALQEANRAVELTQNGTVAGTMARQERDRLLQLPDASSPSSAQLPNTSAPGSQFPSSSSIAGSQIPSSSAVGSGSSGPPLSVSDIEHGLKAGVSTTRMAALVKQYSVDFELTDTIEKELRAAGANDELLLRIARTARFDSSTSPISSPPSAPVHSAPQDSRPNAASSGSSGVDAHDCVKRGITPYQVEGGYVPANPYPVVALQNTCAKAVSVYFCWLVDDLPGNEWGCGVAKIEAGKSTGWMQMAEKKLACVDGRPPDERPDPGCSHFTVVWNAVYADSNQKASRPNVPKRTTPQSAH
jgi:tetratricopeptide (TPR) repeat protein